MSDSSPEFDTVPPALDQEPREGILAPPTSLWGTFRKLGPGLIIAASIVGSGELIATTKTGAQAGTSLFWLIALGCIVKVFAQIELGRYAITHGQTTLNALNLLPGKIGPVNYILWFFIVMMAASTFQAGGIVGGVGQSLAIACPLSGDYLKAIQIPSQKELEWFVQWDRDLSGTRDRFSQLSNAEQTRYLRGHTRLKDQIEKAGEPGQLAIQKISAGESIKDPFTWDDRIWATVVTVLTILLLYSGSYGVLQTLSTILVVAFTATTMWNVLALQGTTEWSISREELWQGFAFHLPPGEDKWAALKTALATFGIIGVGAAELIVYPYWCIERGYARYTGRRSQDEAWAARARGWIRVMQWDAFLSLLIYTMATMAFYFLGAAVLHREGRDPEGLRMVATLASAYVPIFGEYAKWLFLLGAIAVLYSTFLVASAGHARMLVDWLKVAGMINRDRQTTHDRWLKCLVVALPTISLLLYLAGTDPVFAVLTAGFTQAIMLPMLGLGTLYFRWKASDARLNSGPVRDRLWDIALILSFLAFLLTGLWGIYSQLRVILG